VIENCTIEPSVTLRDHHERAIFLTPGYSWQDTVVTNVALRLLSFRSAPLHSRKLAT
jgi:hypothetical protein